jgi:hypothetical protein
MPRLPKIVKTKLVKTKLVKTENPLTGEDTKEHIGLCKDVKSEVEIIGLNFLIFSVPPW